MPTLAKNPDGLVETIKELEEGDEIIVNARSEPMTVTRVQDIEYEPIDMRFVQCEGSRGGLYAIRVQEQKRELPDVGLMRYHKTKGRWVNASEGLMSLDVVND